jgi:hypothetical protein
MHCKLRGKEKIMMKRKEANDEEQKQENKKSGMERKTKMSCAFYDHLHIATDYQ